MDILIIGGTRFLGRAYSEEIVKQSHNLTLFNRGQSNPDFMPEVERITGDRETELANLGDRSWDVVIDTCGYVPRIVKLSAEYLKDRVKTYVFISSISAYQPTEEMGIGENAPLGEMEDETIEEVNGDTYGPLKVLCENTVLDIYQDNAIIIRPGLIVGPHDPTNRFTYWMTRIREGGKTLAPGDGTMPSQFVDARDIAKFTLKLLDDGKTGIYNVTGPENPVPLKDLLDKFKEITNSDSEFIWIENEWLLENEVGPWMEVPLWIPDKKGEALMAVSIDAATSDGLEFRSLEDITKDTLEWYDTINGHEKEWNAGLDRDKEKELLAKYENTPI